MSELPEIDNQQLAACTPAELIDIMITHEDRVPRNVIDECARRGESMLDALTPIAQPDNENDSPGYWWLRLHAVMILGLMPGEAAGHLLVAFIHGLNQGEKDEDLQDWLSGYWPALLRNTPPEVTALLHDLCSDKKMDWYLRTNITEAVLSGAHQQGGTILEEALDWAAQFTVDEEEDWNYRFSTANNLLSYPRERHHGLIMKLSSREHGLAAFFDEENVNQAYARGTDIPIPDGFSDPWKFYDQKEIEQRQRRWQEESLEWENSNDSLDDVLFPDNGRHDFQEPYQRETPKTGRNEPCPCGSGKKYKKCCLNIGK